MKMKAFFLALAVAGAAAAFGLTATGRSDTGTTTGTTTTGTTATTTGTTTTTPNPTPDGCHRFELHGTLTAVSASSFTATVKQGDEGAKASAGASVTVAVGPDTRVSWEGRGTLTGPNVGDAVRANGKLCGSTLTAYRVDARAAKKDESSDGEHKAEHGSSSSTTTTSTTSPQDGHSSDGKHGEHGDHHK